ncbi:MAG: hypothetical protein CBC82_07525 [Cellvibrionales bacterium TMED122]|nr:MAG: hypothetical protein CBC82_07525 [Cellvibrionales bacterium TMED122]|tara:strand:- start:3625 stop:5286 length:1662 start_codon:yes stop_codon:yes gene_type:complete
MINLLKLILPNLILNVMRWVLLRVKINPNDPRRFWKDQDLFLKDDFFDGILDKKTQFKKITYKNQTKPFFLSNKKSKISLTNFNNNDEIRFTYFFENKNLIGNNIKIQDDETVVLEVSNAKPRQFYNFRIFKKSENLYIDNNSNSKLWISIERAGKKPATKNNLNNIFLIFLDSISLDFLEKNLDKMPFTKKFFKDKVSYQNVYSNADWTASALTCLINSEFPSSHRFTDLKTSHNLEPVNENNLFSFFKDNGYITNFLHRAKAQNPEFGFDKDVDNYFYYPYAFGNEEDDQKITNKVLELLYTNIDYKNFFLLHFNSTHYPFSNDNLFNQINNTNFYNDNPHNFLESVIDQKGRTKIDNLYSREGVSIMNNKLTTSLRYLDLQLNSLYSFILEKDLFETTNIIITSDNGTTYADDDQNFFLNERRSKVPFMMSNKKYKINNIDYNDLFSNLIDFKSIAKNMIYAEKFKLKKYTLGELIFNDIYEVCFFYKEKRINFSCKVDQKKNRLYVNKEFILYESNSKKIYKENINSLPEDLLKLVNEHIANTNFEVIK